VPKCCTIVNKFERKAGENPHAKWCTSFQGISGLWFGEGRLFPRGLACGGGGGQLLFVAGSKGH
jgi:hypothetical protein